VIVLPAIDLRGGRCVRLRQGDYARETVFDADPVGVARRFAEAGARWLHVVDLDGAREGEPKNLETVARIVEAAGLRVEVGGGVRTAETAERVIGLGVARVVVGTRAVREPAWLADLAHRFPGRVALGLDVREGRVAVEGWRRGTERTAEEVLAEAEALPLAAIIYTDIARDGMMTGPNVEAVAEMARRTRLPVVASGGVRTVEDVARLRATEVVAGVIIGRALYEGTLTLEAALEAAGDQEEAEATAG